MRHNNRQHRIFKGSQITGFTIVETLVVLAVTSMLFIGVIATFSGQQGRTEFTQAAREMESRVQDILNDVSTGYFPSSGAYTCRVTGTTIDFTPGGTDQQGTNSGCIFIGRVIQFNTDQYRVYSVAGKRLNNAQDVTTLTEADPTVIAPTGSLSTQSWPDATEVLNYPNQITVKSVRYGATSVDAAGFFSTFGSQSTSGLKSGTISVDLLAIGNGGANKDQNAMVGIINGLPTGSQRNPSGGITVCLDSGTSNQRAILQIGGSSRQVATEMVIEAGSCP